MITKGKGQPYWMRQRLGTFPKNVSGGYVYTADVQCNAASLASNTFFLDITYEDFNVANGSQAQSFSSLTLAAAAMKQDIQFNFPSSYWADTVTISDLGGKKYRIVITMSINTHHPTQLTLTDGFGDPVGVFNPVIPVIPTNNQLRPDDSYQLRPDGSGKKRF